MVNWNVGGKRGGQWKKKKVGKKKKCTKKSVIH